MSDTHTHLLTLGTGPDREEIRLWAETRYLYDDAGNAVMHEEYDDDEWTFCEGGPTYFDPAHPVAWTLEAV